MAPPPADADEIDQRVRFEMVDFGPAATKGTAGIRPGKDQMRYPLLYRSVLMSLISLY